MNLLESTYLQIFLGLLSALVLFLYAIENLTNELQSLASERFREIIAKLVRNKYLGTLVGAFATAITQSSSAVTVLAVVLVNTGVISFSNSLGIIFGSNIGTTVTAQLALVNSATIASILIILGFFLGIVSKKSKLISKPIFFLGLILFTLNLLSSSIEPLQNNPVVMELFSHLSNPLLAYFVSALFTVIIQSSSITTGIVVILTLGGVIPVEVGISMVLGANIGSSVTALISSLRLNLYAKRAGIANFLFNLLGTTLFMLLLSPFVSFMQSVVGNAGQQVALAHLFFNLFNTGIFLIFLKPFEKFVTALVKGQEEEILFMTKYIDNKKKGNLEAKMNDIKKELVYSIENTIKIFQKAMATFYNPSRLTLMEIHKLETLNDFLDDEITEEIVSLADFKLSETDAQKTVTLVKVSNTIEQLGDLGNDFSKVFERMHNLGVSPEDVNIEKLTDIYNELIRLFREIEQRIADPKEDELQAIKPREEEIYAQIRQEFDSHVHKLQENEDYNGSIFVDAVSIIELSVSKVRDIRKLLLRQVRGFPE
ncbi:MAG: Na/Pi symporter [Candidatus Dojkabacteria bacterium]